MSINPTLSFLRQWADANYCGIDDASTDNKQRLLQLSSYNIWLITRFCAYPDEESTSQQYTDDYSMFEWAAYVFSQILDWSENQITNEKQELIPQFLIEMFLRRFEKETNILGAREVFENRLYLYGYFTGYTKHRGHGFDSSDYLSSLIRHSMDTRALSCHQTNDPVFEDVSESMDALKQIILASSLTVIPRIKTFLRSAYEASK